MVGAQWKEVANAMATVGSDYAEPEGQQQHQQMEQWHDYWECEALAMSKYVPKAR